MSKPKNIGMDFGQGFKPSKRKRLMRDDKSDFAGKQPTKKQRLMRDDKSDFGGVNKFKPKTKTTTKKVVKKKTTVDYSKQGSPYKIKSGDTLSAIAKKRGTTVAKIMAANPSIKDKNKIFAGRTLKMPGITNLMAKPTLRPSKRGKGSKAILSAIKSSMPKSKVTKSKVTKSTIKGLDAKGNYKGTNIKPSKLQLSRLKKRK